MLEYVIGDILESEAEAIVIPVNCEGRMGKGLALQMKDRYPRAFGRYTVLCATDQVKIGKVGMVPVSKYTILFFPTKDEWRKPSKLNYIQSGLEDLAPMVSRRDFKTLALPKLGCGLGGLGWGSVRPLIEEFGENPGTRRCRIIVYVTEEDLE